VCATKTSHVSPKTEINREHVSSKKAILHNVGLCWTTLATWWQRRRAGDEGNTAYASKIDEDVPLRQRDRRILCCQSGQELFVFLSLLDDIDRSQRVRRLPQMILQQKHRRQRRTYDVSYR